MRCLSIETIGLMAMFFRAGAQTNSAYVTEDPAGKYSRVPPTAEELKAAEGAKEARPADQDMEGNWGRATEGFRLSVRLSKSVFTNGEPVVATVFLRNVTDGPLIYFISL